jgi:hypothetical protein
MFTTRLSARVAARNLANKTANEFAPQLVAFLKPYMGKKVRKADGWTKAIEAAMKEVGISFPYTNEIRITRESYSNDSLRFTVSVSELYKPSWCDKTGPSSLREEASLYIGKTDSNGVLIELKEEQGLRRTDYTEEQILTAREAVKRAEEALSEAKQGLCGFDTYDRP